MTRWRIERDPCFVVSYNSMIDSLEPEPLEDRLDRFVRWREGLGDLLLCQKKEILDIGISDTIGGPTVVQRLP